ncbi:MAG: amino acid ABC transporter permease [Lachnospirales bacterium]
MKTIFSIEAWKTLWRYNSTFFLGLENTLLTAIFALFLSLFLGIIFGLMATSNKKSLKILTRIYVEFIQNTPLILQLCFLYYFLAFTNKSLGIITTGIISIGIYHGAYMAEVVRTGIESIPIGQFEAADSQGFSYFQKMQLIILPQSIKIILPPMVNQVVNLVKNTSCLYIIGGADLISSTYSFVTGVNTGGAYGPAYLVCGILFFIICFPLSTLASIWENSLKKRYQRKIKATEGMVA